MVSGESALLSCLVITFLTWVLLSFMLCLLVSRQVTFPNCLITTGVAKMIFILCSHDDVLPITVDVVLLDDALLQFEVRLHG